MGHAHTDGVKESGIGLLHLFHCLLVHRLASRSEADGFGTTVAGVFGTRDQALGLQGAQHLRRHHTVGIGTRRQLLLCARAIGPREPLQPRQQDKLRESDAQRVQALFPLSRHAHLPEQIAGVLLGLFEGEERVRWHGWMELYSSRREKRIAA